MPAGKAEKIVHSLRNCIEEYWMQEEDFVVFKVFALVLQKLISNIDVDDECLQLLLQAW